MSKTKTSKRKTTNDAWDFTAEKAKLAEQRTRIEAKLAPVLERQKALLAGVDEDAVGEAEEARVRAYQEQRAAFKAALIAKADAQIASGAYLFREHDRVNFDYNHYRPSTVNPEFERAYYVALGIQGGEKWPTSDSTNSAAHYHAERFLDSDAKEAVAYRDLKERHDRLEKLYRDAREARDEIAQRLPVRADGEARKNLERELGTLSIYEERIRLAEASNVKNVGGRKLRAIAVDALISGGYRAFEFKPTKA